RTDCGVVRGSAGGGRVGGRGGAWGGGEAVGGSGGGVVGGGRGARVRARRGVTARKPRPARGKTLARRPSRPPGDWRAAAGRRSDG
ncbi:hypothetical protein DIJ62_26705, partial [Burkholderia pseudomallei]